MSKRFRREIVSASAVFAVLLLYLPFGDTAWGIYAAICSGYTLLVFGLLWSDGKWSRYIRATSRSQRELIQGHLTFLLVLVSWIWVCRFTKPWLPDWLFNLGPRDVSLYLIFSGLGIVAIWWIEQSWLARAARSIQPIKEVQ